MDEISQISQNTKQILIEKQTELITIIDALHKLNKSEEWNVLRSLVFDKSVESIERQLLNSSLNPKIDIYELYKLQGERMWAKRFADIDRFASMLTKQLEDIKKQLK